MTEDERQVCWLSSRADKTRPAFGECVCLNSSPLIGSPSPFPTLDSRQQLKWEWIPLF